jgi:threonine dehydrogenase-like Zn-dependent dehydrogenase
VGQRECALNVETFAPKPGLAVVRTLFSGVSRGTERLVFEGRVPASEAERMRGPNMAGAFPFPVKYGYCAVGEVVDGPAAILGRRAFALHPHQAWFALPPEQLTILPDALPSRRAVIAANMETALNALWDAGASAGDRIAVVGAGVVGLLVASLCAKLPGADVTVVDMDVSRAAVVSSLGARFTAAADITDADIVFHCSASADGLNAAIGMAGFEARIIELSWHGSGETPVALGGAFHSRRLKLISSQVGTVSDSRRARWSYARRMAKALELLAAEDRLDALLTDDIPFADAPARLPALFAPGAQGLTAVLSYAGN